VKKERNVAKRKKIIKLISWNVNGLRAAVKKNFFNSFKQLDADIFALQETKLQEPQLTTEMKDKKRVQRPWHLYEDQTAERKTRYRRAQI
jgi:exodeoxyribonuclease-3